MAIIVPENPVTRTQGEKEVIECCKMALSDSWYLFYETFISGVRPDLILFSEYYGILIFEIKDYIDSSILYISPDRWIIKTDEGDKFVDSPLKQVSEYAFNIINLLSTESMLVHSGGPFVGRLVFPVTVACVFPKLSKKSVEVLGITSVIPQHLVLTKEDLNSDFMHEKIENIFKKSFSIPPLGFKASTIIRQKLYPQIHVKNNDLQKDFWSFINVRVFPNFVDELLFISTEIRHLNKTKNIALEDIIIFYGDNRSMKKKDLVSEIQTIIADMGINSITKNEEPVENKVKVLPLEKLNEVSFNVSFIVDCNKMRGKKQKEVLLEKLIAKVSKQTIYFTSHE